MPEFEDYTPESESEVGLTPVPLAAGPFGTSESDLVDLFEERERAIGAASLQNDVQAVMRYKEEQAEVLYLLGHRNLVLGRLAEAVDELDGSYELNVQVAGFLRNLLEQPHTDPELTEATRERLDILEEFNELVEGLTLVSSARLSLSSSYPERAVEQFRRARKFITEPAEALQLEAYEYMSEGLAKMKYNDFREASTHFANSLRTFERVFASNEFTEVAPEDNAALWTGVENDYNLARYFRSHCAGLSYFRNGRYQFATGEFERAVDIGEQWTDLVEALGDTAPAETVSLISGIWLYFIDTSMAYRHLSTGRTLQDREDFERARAEYESARERFHRSAEHALGMSDPNALGIYQLSENSAREVIPNYILMCEREERLVEQRNRAIDERDELRAQLMNVANRTGVHITNTQEASAVATASAEITQEIKPKIVQHATELLEELASSDLSEARQAELTQLAAAVRDSEDEPSFFDKLKSLARSAKEVLAETDGAMGHAKNIFTVLTFFAMFV